jgi:hypothetical protein
MNRIYHPLLLSTSKSWIASSLRSSQLVYLGEANDGHCERSEAIQSV